MKSKIWRNFTFLCEAYSRHMAFLKNSKCSVIKVSGMRLRSSIDQARKLVAHEFPLYPWAQRKERSQMGGYHLRLPFIYFFSFSFLYLSGQKHGVGEKYWNPRGKDLWDYDTLLPAAVSSFFLCPAGIISLTTLTSILLIEENSVYYANARKWQSWNSPKNWGIVIQGRIALIHLSKWEIVGWARSWDE